MATFTATQVSVMNNNAVVTINSGESIVNIQNGDFLIINNVAPAEIARAYVGPAGEQYIELVVNWKHTTQTNQPAIVLPTTVEVRKAVTALQNAGILLNDNFEAMQSWQTKTGTVTFKNLDGTETTVPTLSSFLSTLGSAATKNVGAGLSEIPNNTQLNTRLGTTANLGKAAVADIIGTVSQSGGVPTGAIIERGSNVKGEYTKFADGLIIITAENIEVTWEGSEAAYRINFIFPAEFKNKDSYTALATLTASSLVPGEVRRSNSAVTNINGEYCVIRFWTDSVISNPVDQLINITAIGRWY